MAGCAVFSYKFLWPAATQAMGMPPLERAVRPNYWLEPFK